MHIFSDILYDADLKWRLENTLQGSMNFFYVSIDIYCIFNVYKHNIYNSWKN